MCIHIENLMLSALKPLCLTLPIEQLILGLVERLSAQYETADPNTLSNGLSAVLDGHFLGAVPRPVLPTSEIAARV